ncbi:MAG: OFA family MFS transporter [Halioglobus sp.]
MPAIAGMLCLCLGAGLIGVYGFFVKPLSDEFGVGAAVINIGPAALLLVPGIVSPFVGRLADRMPVRRMVLIGATVAMASLYLISRVSELYLAALLFMVFSFGLTFYGPVVVNGLMVRQYPGREARAVAVAAIGISVASVILAPLMGFLLSTFTWREALAWLAAGVWCLLMLVSFCCLPAGTGGAAASQERAGAAIVRRREFWLIGLGVAMGMSVTVVLAIIYPPHFVSQGYSLEQAGWFLALAGFSGFLGKTGVAWVGDAGRPYARWLAAALLALQLGGLALLLQAQSAQGVAFAMVLLGSGAGAFLPMHPFLNSRYFGADVISQVIGSQMPLFLPFGLIGAPLAGYVFDQSGSYEPAMIGLAVMLVGAIGLLLALPAADD